MKDMVAKFRAGGVYIPPHKMRKIQEELAKEQDGIDFQKIKWEALRKSLNGLVNKVNSKSPHFHRYLRTDFKCEKKISFAQMVQR